MSERSALETACTLVVALAAVSMVGLEVSERGSARRGAGGVEPSSEALHDWREQLAGGLTIGPADAELVITEFVDFECPFCRMAVLRVDSIFTRYPGKVALALKHYPLSNHPQAMPAAVAFECAGEQGVVEPIYRLFFEKQDSLGLKSWVSFADDAGVDDAAEFEACLQRPLEEFDVITRDMDLAFELGVRGTPTFWANGERTSQVLLGRIAERLMEQSEADAN